jgi:hypothetical protein
MPNRSPAPPPNLDSGFRRNDGGQRRTWLKKFAQAAKNLKHSNTKDTKDLEIDTVNFLNFVTFATFVVKCLRRFWLRLRRVV